MKVILPLVFLLLFVHMANAQSRVIAKSDYDAVFDNAVRATNEAFPFVFTVITDTYENGKVVSTKTEIAERQAEGVERETQSLTKGGQTLRSYSVMVGYGTNTYCSEDGTIWTGPQQFVCPGPDALSVLRLYSPRTPESVEYTVTEKSLNGKAAKIYREYSVFASSEPKGKKDFRESISTIDSHGLFIEVMSTEGTLDPRTVTRTRRQTWKLNAKFAPVKAPK